MRPSCAFSARADAEQRDLPDQDGPGIETDVNFISEAAMSNHIAAGTAGHIGVMPVYVCRLRCSDCSRWQQRSHIRQRAPARPGCPTGPYAQLRAAHGDLQHPAVPAVNAAVASAAAMPALLSAARPATAADELPAADGAQASIQAVPYCLPAQGLADGEQLPGADRH